MKRLRLLPGFAFSVIALFSLSGCGRGDVPSTASQTSQPAVAKPGAKTTSLAADSDSELLRARKGFVTKVSANPKYVADGPVDPPPAKLFKVVRYPSAVGPLAAYLSPDPGDGKKRPAVIYAHGGFGGINGFDFGREHFAPLRDAGFVICCPSWRGENDNPGRYEMFYGEVDDALAVIAYLGKLPYVDAERIYMIGHSTGGTVTLLTAEANPRLRAAFSFGGAPDLRRADYGNTPFDRRVEQEVRLRSPIDFVQGLKVPTWYFEGDQPDDGYIPDARRMQALAQSSGAPFTLRVVEGGTHFDIVRPLCQLLARKLQADTGPACNVSISAQEVRQAFAGR